MRVLHVIGPMTVGGAQTQLLGLVRAAHGRLWDATICATAPGPMVDEFRALGVEVVTLRRVASPGLGRVFALRRLVRQGRFDVVHSNLWAPNAYTRLAVACMRRRPGVVISERNVEAHRARWQRLLDRLLARWTDAWVANSDGVAQFTAGVHPVDQMDVTVIANAVDSSVFTPAAEQRRSGHVVGGVGRLFEEKGWDVLIDAVRALALEYPDVELRIAGVGPMRDQLERRANGLSVSFVGPLAPGFPVADFIRGLDVFVLPSRYREGRPNVVLEALACGVPVVMSDVPGLEDVSTLVARTVGPDDSNSLRDALDDVLGGHAGSVHVPVLRGFEQLADDYRSVFDRSKERTRSAGSLR